MSETVIRSNGRTFFPSKKATVAFTHGWPGYIKRPHPPARPHSTESAHAEIGNLLSPLNFLAQFGRLDFNGDHLPYDELLLSLLNTEHSICEWKDEWLPKFRDVHVLPVEVIGREYPSYHDAICGIGGQFALCVCRKFNAPNLGETTWDAYFAAVAGNVSRRWGEFVQFLLVDSIFAQVDWHTLTEAFQDEGRRAVEYGRREVAFSRPRSPAEWRRIFKHLNDGVPYGESQWKQHRNGRLAEFLLRLTEKSYRVRLDCPFLPDDFDDAKRY